ncbi:MAG: aspartate aminotransferase family protein [Anaerolineae bacterium]|nr:aspartate aminotransferase family protein [Anaerolineae bacterium]
MDDHRADLLAAHRQYLYPAVTPLYGEHPIIVERARDQYVWDVDGTRYLDFFGGVLTVSVGHANEEVTACTIAQLQTVQHTSTLYLNPIMVRLAQKLAEITPGRLQRTYFTSSGTEANETAVLTARMYTGHQEVITLRHAYAGRSVLGMSLTGQGTWRLGGATDPHVRHVRNPYPYRLPPGLDPDRLVDFLVQDLEETLATVTGGKLAAFMAEPIQGVGGFIVAPADYFKRIWPVVRAAGGLLIIDEVQTGWGRTGHFWCGIEHWGVEPDIITFAKGLANGAPIGATITTPEIAEAVQGLTFATFGGNPVSMASALATIEFIEKHNLLENAAVQGARLRAGLEALRADFPLIGDVRGMGLMQALEIVQPGQAPDRPALSRWWTAARAS